MNLAHVIAGRVAATGARDPDTLHGLLLLEELGNSQKKLCKATKRRTISELLDKARNGEAGKVDAFYGDELRREPIDFPDGLMARKWKRELVALLLRAGGAVTADVEAMLVECEPSLCSADAITEIRRELKPLGVKVDSYRVPGQLAFRFQITGRSAWRMQKIIANGWSL